MVTQFRQRDRFKLALREGKENIRCIPRFPLSILYLPVMLHFAFLRAPKSYLNFAHKSLHPLWNIAVSCKRTPGRPVPSGYTRGGGGGGGGGGAQLKENQRQVTWREALPAWKAGEPRGSSHFFCSASTTVFGLKAHVFKAGKFYLLTTRSQQFQQVGNGGLQGRKGSSKERTEEAEPSWKRWRPPKINSDINGGRREYLPSKEAFLVPKNPPRGASNSQTRLDWQQFCLHTTRPRGVVVQRSQAGACVLF